MHNNHKEKYVEELVSWTHAKCELNDKLVAVDHVCSQTSSGGWYLLANARRLAFTLDMNYCFGRSSYCGVSLKQVHAELMEVLHGYQF